MDREPPPSEEDRKRQDQPLRCSFCGKGQADVRKLIAGRRANICDECIKVCVDIIAVDPASSVRDVKPPGDQS